jgi:hypothetical protein
VEWALVFLTSATVIFASSCSQIQLSCKSNPYRRALRRPIGPWKRRNPTCPSSCILP